MIELALTVTGFILNCRFVVNLLVFLVEDEFIHLCHIMYLLDSASTQGLQLHMRFSAIIIFLNTHFT